MMREVQAACEGANILNAKEIWIKDAHGVGRNLDFSNLPENVKLIRSFIGHPFSMMQELDSTFDAVLMIGYHSFAGSDKSPLAHTLETDLSYIKINGEYASEFLINAYTASLVDVPVVFVSGDEGICESIKAINENIKTVKVGKGIGNSVISNHPNLVYKQIVHEVEDSLKCDINRCKIDLPNEFKVELGFIEHTKAYKASFYPGMKKTSSVDLVFETKEYFEVLRMLNFVV